MGAKGVRNFFSLIWSSYSVLWVYLDGIPSVKMTEYFGLLILAVYIGFQMIRRTWRHPVLPMAALLVLTSWPIKQAVNGLTWALKHLIDILLNFPIGLLAIVGSFVLFGFGTWLAFRKREKEAQG